jgi:hypothetical protein
MPLRSRDSGKTKKRKIDDLHAILIQGDVPLFIWFFRAALPLL